MRRTVVILMNAMRWRWAGDADQALCEVGAYPPVVKLVGFGQCAEQHVADDVEVVEFFAMRLQADNGVARTCALHQLSDYHHPELLRFAFPPQVFFVQPALGDLRQIAN